MPTYNFTSSATNGSSYFHSQLFDHDIVNVDNGAVLTTMFGTVISGDGYYGGSLTLNVNNGSLVTEVDTAVVRSYDEAFTLTVAAGSSIRNTSYMQGGNAIAVYDTGGPYSLGHTTLTGTNAGLIEGSIGLLLTSLQSGWFRNTGTIQSNVAGADGNAVVIYATEAGVGAITFRNEGTLSGLVNYNGEVVAFRQFDYSIGPGPENILGQVVKLYNTGTVNGAVELGRGGDTVLNSGSITGWVSTGGDADVVGNSGSMGAVDLGDGDDKYFTRGSSYSAGTVSGGAGSDRLLGGLLADDLAGGADGDLVLGRDGNDTLNGDGGADTLRGGNGTDSMDGGTEDDLIYGDAGNDTMSGGAGNDLLNGGADNDSINGDAGADRIWGGTGDDTINGGAGADISYGGAGADTFVFTAASDSGAATADGDRLRDFEAGVDTIDLSAVYAGTLAWFGTGAFDGVNAGVRLAEINGTMTVVEVDVNGDGTRDMRIWVSDSGLAETDFVL